MLFKSLSVAERKPTFLRVMCTTCEQLRPLRDNGRNCLPTCPRILSIFVRSIVIGRAGRVIILSITGMFSKVGRPYLSTFSGLKYKSARISPTVWCFGRCALRQTRNSYVTWGICGQAIALFCRGSFFGIEDFK